MKLNMQSTNLHNFAHWMQMLTRHILNMTAKSLKQTFKISKNCMTHQNDALRARTKNAKIVTNMHETENPIHQSP